MDIFAIFFISAMFQNVIAENSDTKLVPKKRIHAGEESKPHSKPYVVALYIQNKDGEKKFCGGSLLSPNLVLTAGHCIYRAQDIKVLLGAWDLEYPERSKVSLKVVDTVLHNDFDATGYKHDIGLAILENKVNITEYVKPIRLAAPTAQIDFDRDLGEIMGWGATNQTGSVFQGSSATLQIGNIGIMDYNTCRKFLPMISPNNFCGFEKQTRTSGCIGDGGGPLIINGAQYGVMSFPHTICDGSYPTVFTDIRKYTKFMKFAHSYQSNAGPVVDHITTMRPLISIQFGGQFVNNKQN